MLFSSRSANRWSIRRRWNWAANRKTSTPLSTNWSRKAKASLPNRRRTEASEEEESLRPMFLLCRRLRQKSKVTFLTRRRSLSTFFLLNSLSLDLHLEVFWIKYYKCPHLYLISKTIFFSVHVKLEEKIMLTAGRDGGLQSMELMGMLSIRITDEAFGRIKLCIQVIFQP